MACLWCETFTYPPSTPRSYDSDMADERKEIYPLLLTQANITAVVYNGDADLVEFQQRARQSHRVEGCVRRAAAQPCALTTASPPPLQCVPHTDNEAWTASMGYAVTSPWLPWNVPSEHGSYLGGYR